MKILRRSDGYSIAYYHLIGDQQTPYYNAKKVSLKTFKEHIDYFKKSKKFVSFNEITELKKSGEDLSNFVVLTFDDGYRVNTDTIGSFLSDEKIPATFFVTNCVLENKLMWRDHLSYGLYFLSKINQSSAKKFAYSIKNSLDWTYSDFKDKYLTLCDRFNIPSSESIINEWNPYSSVSSFKSLLACGHDIGLHSKSHPCFKNLKPDEAATEIIENNALVKKIFNIDPVAFSFPFGARLDDPDFYQKVLKKTRVKYFCGINGNIFSNSSETNPIFTERLGMEDHRPLFVSAKIRPLVRGFNQLWK